MEFASGLARNWGFAASEIAILTSRGESDERVSWEAVVARLERFANEGALDKLVVGFWGRRVMRADGRELYLCLPETSVERPSACSIPYGNLMQVLAEVGATETFCFLDCCRANEREADSSGSVDEIARLKAGAKYLAATVGHNRPEISAKAFVLRSLRGEDSSEEDALDGDNFTRRFLNAQLLGAKRGDFSLKSVAKAAVKTIGRGSRRLDSFRIPFCASCGRGDFAFDPRPDQALAAGPLLGVPPTDGVDRTSATPSATTVVLSSTPSDKYVDLDSEGNEKVEAPLEEDSKRTRATIKLVAIGVWIAVAIMAVAFFVALGSKGR